MPTGLHPVLLALAIFCFLLAAFLPFFTASTSKFNLMALGLGFFAFSFWSGSG